MQEYIVIELQTGADGRVATLTTAYDDYWTAQQGYHTILAAAAKSALPIHTAVMLNPYGEVIERQAFRRDVTPEGGDE